MLFEQYALSSSRYHSKIIGDVLKNVNHYIYLNEILWLIRTKVRLKMKNRSHRYDINRPRHGHRYTKYKICLNTMTVICMKQHLSNIWSSIHGKVKVTLRLSWQRSFANKKTRVKNVLFPAHYLYFFCILSANCLRNWYLRLISLRPVTLLKKRLQYRCFPVNFEKFLRTLFLIEHLRWFSAFNLWGIRFTNNAPF